MDSIPAEQLVQWRAIKSLVLLVIILNALLLVKKLFGVNFITFQTERKVIFIKSKFSTY